MGVPPPKRDTATKEQLVRTKRQFCIAPMWLGHAPLMLMRRRQQFRRPRCATAYSWYLQRSSGTDQSCHCKGMHLHEEFWDPRGAPVTGNNIASSPPIAIKVRTSGGSHPTKKKGHNDEGTTGANETAIVHRSHAAGPCTTHPDAHETATPYGEMCSTLAPKCRSSPTERSKQN